MHVISKFTKTNILLCACVLLAIYLRVAFAGEVPPSLNWDEVSHGYNAYSILQTGEDEWGVRYPTIFRAFGDYKLPVYIYTTVVSVALFGLNSFAVRLPSVVSGVLLVIVTYFLTQKLFENQKYAKEISLFSAFLVCISPWTLFISRGAFEANMALSFVVLGIYLFLKGLEKPVYLISSAIFFGLSVWTYNSARVFVPILLLFLLLAYLKDLIKLFQKKKILVLASILILGTFLMPMTYQLLNPVGQARYEKVAILEPGAIYQIEEARNSSQLSPFLNKLVNNRVTYFSTYVAKNWVTHYTLDFLFKNGGTQYQFSVPGHGLLYFITAPFLLFGLFFTIKNHTKSSILLVFWFLAGSVASSVTREAPHVLRSVTMLPVPMILSAIGFFVFLEWVRFQKYAITILFIVILCVFTWKYMVHYQHEYRDTYSWSWQYGYEEVVTYAKNHYADYDAIITTKKYGEPHEFFLFFQKWNPETYRDDPNLIRYAQSDWFWVDRFDKFWFINDWQVKEKISEEKFITERGVEIDCSNKRCLMIVAPDTYPAMWSKIESVDFLDGKVAFELYEN